MSLITHFSDEYGSRRDFGVDPRPDKIFEEYYLSDNVTAKVRILKVYNRRTLDTNIEIAGWFNVSELKQVEALQALADVIEKYSI